jgi:glycosyltransferase involved in cell wall biosynthesis
MKILFHSDAIFGRASYGLSRYSQELWNGIADTQPEMELFAYAPRGAPYAASGGEVERCKNFRGVMRSRWAGRLEMASWATIRFPRIERVAPDSALVHSLELDYPVATRKPWVVTIHDLGPLTHPQYFSRGRPWLRERALDQALRSAAAIVAVSRATADAVEQYAGTSLQDRLHVVHEGVSKEFFETRSRDCLTGLKGLPPTGAPYFLWTGSLNPRKNLGNVVRAFELAANHCPHHLVLAGGLGWDHGELTSAIERSVVRDRIHRPGYVSDAQLQALYQGATAFLYVSFFEGFGLPILEAMAGGCPVITSNISSMPEIAGDAALLVDPACPEEIADAMQRLASDEQLRSNVLNRGSARAREFSWDECARSMMKVYHQVA